ncbi:MAG: NAD-dependent epimerase/dehydratase family protein [Acidobacteria bacterium]|nr:NAD-dependent epimerase/dehydratase family protein [Acidobacteriota bacterium]
MRVLVIGGTLFLGRGLVRALLDQGHAVTLLHRGKHNPFGDAVAEVRCDRNDPVAVAQALREGDYEAVFDNVYDWKRGTTAEQVEAAARACGPNLRRYVFTSSVAAYAGGLDHDEDDPLAPDDCPDKYSRDKAQTERMLLGLHRECGFPAVTLRPPFIYGPENPFEREQFFWDRILRDRPVLVPDDGERLMQFVYRDDFVRAALLALETEAAAGRAYNIAHAAPITQAELVAALARAAGRDVRLVFVKRAKLLELGGNVFQPPFYFAQYYDMPPITQKIERARRELGFEPSVFEDSLRRSFAWYQSLTRPEPDFSFDDKVLASVGAL